MAYRRLIPVDPTTGPELQRRCMRKYKDLGLFVQINSIDFAYPKMFVWGRVGGKVSQLATTITSKHVQQMEDRLDEWALTQCEYEEC